VLSTYPSCNRRRFWKQKKKGKKANHGDERADLIEKSDMVNDRFFEYYKAQEIVPQEEWDDFVDVLRQHLPTTFRVTGSRQYVSAFGIKLFSRSDGPTRAAKGLNELIKETHVPSLSNVTFEDQKIPPPVQIPW
jgi:multisite-specific tRNA:(cytosine-C5)-methyltransferase